MFELYKGLPRQGPGSDEATLDALSRINGLPANPDILDVGCGSGKQTLVLAGAGGNVVAVDTHQPFLDELERRALARGLSGRIRTLNRSMDALDFPDGSFDLIWSEGAIYIMGFARGLAAWKRLLRPGGYIAVTELSWLTDAPPREAAAFWAENYPAMKTVPENIGLIREAGYEPLEPMVLPESAWWEDYYLMLEKRIKVCGDAYRGDPVMHAALAVAKREIDIYRAHAHSYGYVFFIMRAGAR